MIKLFWNTANLDQTITKNQNKEDKRNYQWGVYHKKNSSKWIMEILSKVKIKEIENIKDLNNGDTLLIVDSSVEKKSAFYTKLKLICSKIFLIHLGDESGIYNLSEIYDQFNYVWRAFCSNKYFNNLKVSCLPIGYKSGTLLQKKLKNRKYKWAFIGTPHKSSRHDLLFQLSEISPSFCHKTQKFNEKIIEVDKMSEILSATEFMPCPNGFVHPETYRLYEALECECIPIVENTYKYYDRLFPDNPFLKIDKWNEAKNIINNYKVKEIDEKREQCKIWWLNYKNQLKEFFKKKIENDR